MCSLELLKGPYFIESLGIREKQESVKSLMTTKWQEATECLDSLETGLLELAGYQTGELDRFIQDTASQVAVFTLHGGSATRFKNSLNEPHGRAAARLYGIPNEAKNHARGLVEIPNILKDYYPDDRLTVLGYSLHNVRNLLINGPNHSFGRHVLVYGFEEDRERIERVVQQIGLSNTLFCQQRIREGKRGVTGHGDAMIQQLPLLEEMKNLGTKYILVHFIGDPTSEYTLQMGLLAQHVLSKIGEDALGVLPSTARMQYPLYPVLIDKEGYIRLLGNARLYGDKTANYSQGDSVNITLADGKNVNLSVAGSNVGIWWFDIDRLIAVLKCIERDYYTHGQTFTFLFGHQVNNVNECAIDDVVNMMSSYEAGSHVYQLAIAHPEEIWHTFRDITNIPGFLEMIKRIRKRNIERRKLT